MNNGTSFLFGTGQPVPSDYSPSPNPSTSTSSAMTPPTPTSPSLRADGSKDILLEEMVDPEMRKKVGYIREIFPDREIVYIERAILTFRGDANQVAAFLWGETPPQFAWKVTNLKKLSGNITEHQARDVLIHNKGDLEEAKKHLRTELALVDVDAQIANSPQGSSKTDPSKSFTISTRTHTTSAMKLDPFSIDLTGESDSETSTKPFLNPGHALSAVPVTKKTQGTNVSPIKIESLAENVNKLRELLPQVSSIACDEMLQAWDGDFQKALDEMIKDPSTQQYLGARVSRTRSSKTASTPPAEKVETQEDTLSGNQQQVDTSLIKTERIESKVTQLRELFPQLNEAACKHTLESCDANIQSAIDLLCVSMPTLAEQESLEAKVDHLIGVFPNARRVEGGNALQACGGNTQQAFDMLDLQYTPARGALSDSTASRRPSKHVDTQITPPITPSAEKTEKKQPGSSQRSQKDELAKFFATKLTSPAITEDKETKSAAPMEDEMTGEHSIDDFPMEEDSTDSKIEQLYESLLRQVKRKACRNALEICDGNEEDACEMLAEEYGIFKDSGSSRHRSRSADSHTVGRRKDHSATPKAELTYGSLKRGAETSIARTNKKARVQYGKDDDDQDAYADDEDEDEDEDEKDTRDVHLAPAAQWVKKIYPESTDVVVLLGQERVPYDNIPLKVLRENFQLLKLYIAAALSRNSGPSKMELAVPDVAPETFDLLVQWVICDNIELEAGPNEECISSILKLIAAAIILGIPGLNSLITRMEQKLRTILSRDRLALQGGHIRAAYELQKDGEIIQQMFVLASVRLFLQYRKDNSLGHFEDNEDEDMTAAQRASYSGSGFAFNREMKRYPQFKEELMTHALDSVWSRENEQRRPQRGKVPEIRVAVYTDPLNGKRFEL